MLEDTKNKQKSPANVKRYERTFYITNVANLSLKPCERTFYVTNVANLNRLHTCVLTTHGPARASCGDAYRKIACPAGGPRLNPHVSDMEIKITHNPQKHRLPRVSVQRHEQARQNRAFLGAQMQFTSKIKFAQNVRGRKRMCKYREYILLDFAVKPPYYLKN